MEVARLTHDGARKQPTWTPSKQLWMKLLLAR